jgi:ElaB/YqjD/DUF883 family membrane-anchored ribosome-binding protein
MVDDRKALPETSRAGKSASGASTSGGTVTDIASSVRDTASSAITQAQEAMGQASDAVWQSTQDVRSRAGDVAGQAYEYGRRTVGSVGRPVESPVAYVAVGAAVGLGLWYLVNGTRASGRRSR